MTDIPLPSIVDAPSRIMNGRFNRHHWSGTGPLSIKSFSGGSARYEAGGGHFVVTDDRYLVLNHGQDYTITVDTVTPVESLCVFFEAGFADRVRDSLVLPAERLLDEPSAAVSVPVSFFERTYRHDDIVTPALQRFRGLPRALRQNRLWLQEQLHDLATRLLWAHDNLSSEVHHVPAARAATRDEIYRRVHLARDYAEAYLGDEVTLDDMAGVACMSPNHLLRSFRAVFGCTPHQYLTHRRIERAQQLLSSTDRPITEIGFEVGMQTAGSFSTLFRRRTGMSPEEYRRQSR